MSSSAAHQKAEEKEEWSQFSTDGIQKRSLTGNVLIQDVYSS
jgi:hypothetical protein